MPEKLKSPWTFRSFLESNSKEHKLSLCWQFRLELAERIAKILSDLHRKRRAYGMGGLTSSNVLIQASDKVGLRSLGSYPTLIDHSVPIEEFEDLAADVQKLDSMDQLLLGVLLIEAITQKPLVSNELPQLIGLLRRSGLDHVRVIFIGKKGKVELKAIKAIKDEELVKGIMHQAQNELIQRELIKEDLMRHDYDPEEAVKANKLVRNETNMSQRNKALANAMSGAKKFQKFVGKYAKIAKDKVVDLAKMMNQKRKQIKFPRWENFNRIEIPDSDPADEGRVSRNLLKEKVVKEHAVDIQIESLSKQKKKAKTPTVIDPYVVSSIIKAEVRKYLNPTDSGLTKPSWLLNLFDLVLSLVDSVEDSRPNSKASRNWILEVLKSFEASKEKHEKVKEMMQNSDGRQVSVTETMRQADYIQQISQYDVFYVQTAAEIILDDVKEEDGEVLAYHSKDIPKDLLDDDDEEYFSDDSVMPPLKTDADYVPLATDSIEVPETPMLESNLLKRVNVKNVGKNRTLRNNNESVNSDDQLVIESELPPIIGPKADALLNQMDKQRKDIGQIPTPKQVGKLFDEQKKLKHNEIVSLLKRAREILDAEPNILEIDAPVIVVGDIHGQYFDLRQVMKFCGRPKKNVAPPSGRGSVQKSSRRSAKSNRASKMIQRLLRRPSNSNLKDDQSLDKLVFNQEEFIQDFEEHKATAKQKLQLPKFKSSRRSILKDQGNMLASKTLAPGTTLDGGAHSEAEPTSFVDDVEDKGKQFLFLGDYVDRGAWSCEVLFYLLSLKVHYKNSVIMLRGNHECDTMAETYGFREECEHKYGREVYHRCVQVFSSLPIACLVNLPNGKRFLACHGGISDQVVSLEQIARLERRREPGVEGVLCDLLWSDPVPDDVCLMYNLPVQFQDIEYIPNDVRGCAKKFGIVALERFLQTNNLIGMIRAHEAKEEGYQFHFQNVGTKGHLCITVFSAPNYMNEHGNKGAVMLIHQSVKDRLVHQMKRLKYKYTVDQVLRQADRVKDDYLDLLEPICYHEVPQPEVVAFENENNTIVSQIEDTCPYMPTIVDDFYNSSLDILEKYGNAQKQLETYQKEQEAKVKEIKEELARIQAEMKKFKGGGGRFESMRFRGSMKMLRASTKKLVSRVSGRPVSFKDLQHEQFQKTIKKVNEQHPQVLEEKLRIASSRLEKMENASYAEDDIGLVTPRLLGPDNMATVKRARALSAGNASEKERREIMASLRRSKRDLSNTASGLAGDLSSVSEAEEDNKAVVKQLNNRGVLKRQRIEVDHKEQWLELLSSWFTAIAKEDIVPETLCPALTDCVLLCEAAALVADKPNLKFYKPKLNSELSPFEVRRNLIVFQDVCKELKIYYMFLVLDLVNVELNYLLPALIELIKIAKKKGKLELSFKVDVDEKIWDTQLSKDETAVKEEGEDAPRGLEVGNVTFNGEERLMLQLLFHMIDLDDTGLITSEAIIAWAREEGKLIKMEHAESVVSALDYDNDGAIGLRDWFQYAARMKEDFLHDEGYEDFEEYETANEGGEEQLFFDQTSDGGFAGTADGPFDPTQAFDITRTTMDPEAIRMSDDSEENFHDAQA